MQRAIRERRKGGNAKVDADRSRSRMDGVWNLHLDLEGHKPLLALPRDGNILDGALDWATVPELDPADHGQRDLACLQFEALRIAKAVGEKLLAVARGAARPAKQLV